MNCIGVEKRNMPDLSPDKPITNMRIKQKSFPIANGRKLESAGTQATSDTSDYNFGIICCKSKSINYDKTLFSYS